MLGRFAVLGVRGLAQVLDGQLVAMGLLRSDVAVNIQAVRQHTALHVVDAAFRLGSLQVWGSVSHTAAEAANLSGQLPAVCMACCKGTAVCNQVQGVGQQVKVQDMDAAGRPGVLPAPSLPLEQNIDRKAAFAA